MLLILGPRRFYTKKWTPSLISITQTQQQLRKRQCRSISNQTFPRSSPHDTSNHKVASTSIFVAPSSPSNTHPSFTKAFRHLHLMLEWYWNCVKHATHCFFFKWEGTYFLHRESKRQHESELCSPCKVASCVARKIQCKTFTWYK